MLGQREVIIIGLGKFGKTVSNNLAHMIEERRIQLGKIANSVIPHYIDFEGDEVFHSTDYENKILESIECSQAYKNGEEFSVIFTGDLYENSTAKYAVDFAYLPHLLQQVTAFKFNEVIGFFTFVDQLGVVESTSEETFALICKHFNRLEKINSKNLYEVPFNTLLNKKLKDIPSPAGPFNRNYVLLTPGKSKSVTDETAVIFAERIFYELFYLSEKLREQSHNWISEVNDKRGAVFPCIIRKKTQVPNTARQAASLPGDISRGKRSSMPQPKTRPDSPVPSLKGPCDRNLKSEVPCGSCLNWR